MVSVASGEKTAIRKGNELRAYGGDCLRPVDEGASWPSLTAYRSAVCTVGHTRGVGRWGAIIRPLQHIAIV